MKNRNGFTLIEVLVALFIFSIISLGILASLGFIAKMNIKNLLREKAVEFSQQCVELYRSTPASSITAGSSDLCKDVEVKIGNITYTFTIQEEVIDVIGDTKKIIVDISWEYDGKKYTYRLESFVSKRQ